METSGGCSPEQPYTHRSCRQPYELASSKTLYLHAAARMATARLGSQRAAQRDELWLQCVIRGPSAFALRRPSYALRQCLSSHRHHLCRSVDSA